MSEATCTVSKLLVLLFCIMASGESVRGGHTKVRITNQHDSEANPT